MGILQGRIGEHQVDGLGQFPSLHILESSYRMAVYSRRRSGLCLCVLGKNLICGRNPAKHSCASDYSLIESIVPDFTEFLVAAVRAKIEIIVNGIPVVPVLSLCVHLDELIGSGNGIISGGRDINRESVLLGILIRL